MILAPYMHQNIALSHLRTNRCFALFMEQGTAKTRPVLMRILELYKSGGISSALVVCPKAVRGSWESDIAAFFNKLDQILLKRCLTITTYDLIWRRPELDRQWDLMVLDESHFIKNRNSNRYAGQMKTAVDPVTKKRRRRRVTRGIRDISRNALYRYILSGTPIGNSRWEEIWAQFDFLDPGILGKYADFEKRYCILDAYYKPCAYRHVDELKEIIAAHSYRITKAECLDLPEKLPPERYSLELLEKRQYKEMLKNYIEGLDIEAKNPLARMTKLRQICSGHIKDEQGTVHKLKAEKAAALNEFLENWDKKLVIFAEYRESIADIRHVLLKRGALHIVLDGDQKDKTIWRRFQEDPEIRVIVCQYRTASAGITLNAADTTLFYEPTLSSQAFEQACDRTHRAGQREKCSYILFETTGTVEVKIWSALLRHRDFSENELWSFVNGERRNSVS
ncbi:MAG: DEAD/DEAH box helicase [Bacillota bacterium]